MQNAMFISASQMRDEFKKKVVDGESMPCPCCQRHAQAYRRSIHHSVAAQLIKLHRLGGTAHAKELIMPNMSGAGDLSKAKYWRLIEQLSGDDPKKKTSGHWRLTRLGRDFVKGEISILKYAHVWDDEVLAFSGPDVFIKDCLGDKFDYSELMGL